MRRTIAVACMVIALSMIFFAPAILLASAEGGHGEHGGAGKSNFDKTGDFFKRVANFAVLVGALVFVLRKPLKNAFASRTQGIKDKLAELEQQQVEAQKKYDEYQSKLTLLDQEAAKIIESYMAQGEKIKAQIIEDAKKAARHMEQQAKVSIQQEFEKAKTHVKREVVHEAVAVAGALRKKQISAEDHAKLIDEYLAKVVVAQ